MPSGPLACGGAALEGRQWLNARRQPQHRHRRGVKHAGSRSTGTDAALHAQAAAAQAQTRHYTRRQPQHILFAESARRHGVQCGGWRPVWWMASSVADG
eukprot:271652-Chlamydomonas_euryale.AAC.2